MALARVVEPGSRAVHAALQHEPATEVWAALRAGAPIGQLGQQALDGDRRPGRRLRPRSATSTACWQLRRPGRCARATTSGRDGLDWDPDVMEGDVKQMAPPWALFVRGPASPRRTACRRSVAVVGARAATAYGTHVAGELAFALAEAG